MLRLRFLPGLILGLLLGLPAGIVIAFLALPPKPTDSAGGVSSQLQELNRKLEAATEARQRADQQVALFQKLAEQMTATFNNLEQRFKLLEEEQRVRDAHAAQATAQPRPSPTQPAPPPTPTFPAQTQAPERTAAEGPAEAVPAETPSGVDPAGPAEPQ